MRYRVGLINLTDSPLKEYRVSENIFDDSFAWTNRENDMTAAHFHDPAAGWVVRGRAAPFIRILEVSDPTAEELAAAQDV